MEAKVIDSGETWAPGSRMASQWRGSMRDGLEKSVSSLLKSWFISRDSDLEHLSAPQQMMLQSIGWEAWNILISQE